VQVHPVSSLGTEFAWQLSASKGARMDQPTQELQLDRFRRVLGLERELRVERELRTL
jgi:hypothetical protein